MLRVAAYLVFAHSAAVILFGAALPTPTAQESQSSSAPNLPDFDDTSGRPLNDALSAIEGHLHVPVNFEEVKIADPSQLVSGQELGLRAGGLYPKGGRLTIHYVPRETNALAAVRTALAASDQAHLPGPYLATQGQNGTSFRFLYEPGSETYYFNIQPVPYQ